MKHPNSRAERRAIARQFVRMREAFRHARQHDDIVGMGIFRRGLASLKASHSALREAV